MTNQNSAAQAAMQRPIDEAIVILTEEAAALRECHTPSGDRDDWTGESEAKAAHDNMLRVAAALSKLRAPVAEQKPIKLSDDVLHFLKEGVENATQCEESDVDQEFADQLLLLMHTPLYTEPLPKQREVDWGPLVAAPVADERVAQEYGSPADVAQRIEQYLAQDGRMNSGTQLLYEAMKALRASQGDRNDG